MKGEYFKEIVLVNGEEGGDDVKLLWFLYFGLYMCYNGVDRVLLGCEFELIVKIVF